MSTKKQNAKRQMDPSKPAREATKAANVNAVAAAVGTWLKAAGGEFSAYLAVFVTVAQTGERVTLEMLPDVAENSAKAIASKFNAAAAVAGILGRDKAVALIVEASKLPGRRHENISTALAAVRAANKEAGNDKGPATGAQVIQFADAAKAAVARRLEAKKAPKGAQAGGKSGSKSDEAPALSEPKELLAALQVLTGRIASMACSDVRKGAKAEAVRCLQKAQEALAKLIK